jgi:biotin carboxyl carrier protein
MAINKKELEEIIKLMEAESIIELELADKEEKIRIKRYGSIEEIGKQKIISESKPKIMPASAQPVKKLEENFYVLKSFMIGKFWRSDKEGGEPLVKENDKVELDQPLGIIESMKNFMGIKLNEYLECQGKFENFTGKYGIIKKIEVEDGADIN